jgi:hypothetical protein
VGPTSRATQMDWRRRLRPARACARQRPGSRAQENRGTARIIQRGSPCLSAIATAREAEDQCGTPGRRSRASLGRAR